MDLVVILGLIAGAVTSMGFIPQLIRGYKTKELDDVSYYMPAILAVGMSLWLLYGFFCPRVSYNCCECVWNWLLCCSFSYEKDLFLVHLELFCVIMVTINIFLVNSIHTINLYINIMIIIL